jgi:signal peptidase I
VDHTKKKETSKLIGTILFFVVAGLLLFYVLIEALLPTMTIKIFQFKPFVVITESMEPVLNVNDMVVATNPNLDNLEVGDIITFEADIDYNGTKEYVTHYIHSISTDGNGDRIFRTNRYGSTVADTWTLRDQDVIGVYWFHIPAIGAVLQFLKSPFGIAAVGVNIVIIGAIVFIVKSDKKGKPQTEQ